MKNTVHPVRLDSVNIELEGVNLIEASAGTGKTYRLCHPPRSGRMHFEKYRLEKVSGDRIVQKRQIFRRPRNIAHGVEHRRYLHRT